jgi:STE24 endopeptidase
LLYAAFFTIVTSLPSLPLSAFATFGIEEKHGFNKSTWGLWVTDQLKSYAIGAVIGLPVLAAFLKIVDYAGDWFIPALMVFL